jgi:hypothetical protein
LGAPRRSLADASSHRVCDPAKVDCPPIPGAAAVPMCSRLRGNEPPIHGLMPIRLAALSGSDSVADCQRGGVAIPAR